MTEEKKLEEFYRELIDDIFRSFSEEHRKHLNLMFREKTSEWLTQKRQEAKSLCELTDEYNKIPEKPDGSDIHFYKALETKQYINVNKLLEELRKLCKL